MSRLGSFLLVSFVLGAAQTAAQEPLFAFAQVSDSQPQTATENQNFIDVLRTLSEAGQPGAVLPHAVDLVLFAGDITWGNTRTEWVAAKQKLDAWLTANGIPYLAVPGNHDVNNSDTALYEEFIADSGVWDAGSASFTGQNGPSRTTSWSGLRFIGFNNSNPGWNTMSSADVADVALRVSQAHAAGENVFLLCHHPHDEKARVPLANVLPNASVVGYLHGHLDSPSLSRGLAGIVNPNVWDACSNAIYLNRALLYYEVFPTELRARVVRLGQSTTTLPPAITIPLVHPLTRSDAGSLGFAGPSHVGARTAPTRRAPERKLWFDSGSWWGILWSESAGAYRIQRLDAGTQTWVDTGPTVSTTAGRSFDVQVQGGTVAVASNLVTQPGALANGSPGQLTRYVFDAGLGRYASEADYPVSISDARSPSLVLARDGTGQLWAGWTRGGEAYVSHSLASDASWSAPIRLASGIGTSDTLALVAFDGQVGALWSDSVAGTLVFARHADGAVDTAWSQEIASTQSSEVGTKLDVVTADGRVLAAVQASGGTLNLLARTTFGDWSASPLATAADGLHDPLLVVDRSLGLLRLFATAPTPGDQSLSGGGAFYTKVASLAAPAFPPGRGTAVAEDGAHPSLDFATSARAPVNAQSGLVVLGSVGETQRYWHATDALTTLPRGPVAEFAAISPRLGPAPLVVEFQDLSTGDPTYWSWDFGDGTTSRQPNPSHVYAATGLYTVQLRVANGGGQDLRTRTAYVEVTAPAPVRTFTPVADARVYEGSVTRNAGSDPVLRVKAQAGSSYQSYLRFDLGTLPGPVVSAKLRLFCSDASNSAGSVYAVSSVWNESTLNWSNRPPLQGSALATVGNVAANTWAEFTLPPGAVSSALVSFAVAGGNTNSAYYSSREGAQPPELVLDFGGSGTAPVAAFTGTPLTGPAPLTVQFTDTSTGAPATWSWDFGDGASSSARNPSHTYDQPGVYTVVLDASNGSGLDSLTRLDYVVVTTPVPVPVRTFVAVADARVNQGSTSRNYGGETSLRVRDSSGSSQQSFLRFDLASLSGSVVSAKLRLWCTDGSNAGGAVYTVASGWTESGITWNNRPALPASPVATLGSVSTNAWTEIDVTGAVVAAGALDLALAGGSSNMALYSSREGAHPPELVVETGTPTAPVAAFSAAPLAGGAPLLVSFTDLSTGATSWAWDFGDGASSTERSPTHLYTLPGSYSVSLQVANALGTDQILRTGLVTVGAAPAQRTFLPVADARVNEASPGSNAGSNPVLRVREAAGGSYHTYLRFDLAGLAGPVVSAKLRLFSTDGSPVAGVLYRTSGAWTEAGITWNNAPGPIGGPVTSVGEVATGAWAEFDVGSLVSGPGTLDVLLRSTSTNSCYYSGREGANPPELVVTTAP